MSILAQHVAVLILNHADQYKDHETALFQVDLVKRLSDKWDKEFPVGLIDEAVQILVEIRGCEILPSPLTGPYCKISKLEAEYYFLQQPTTEELIFSTYEDDSKRLKLKYPIICTYFSAGTTWVERVGEAIQALDLEGELSTADVPAPLVDSSAWTGRTYYVSDDKKAQIAGIIDQIDGAIDDASLPNSDVVRIKALTSATRQLLVPADPEWALILRILQSPIFANLTALAALAVALIKS